MIKAKWVFPFVAFTVLTAPPPPDVYVRVHVVAGVFAVTAVLLAIIQPWRADGRS